MQSKLSFKHKRHTETPKRLRKSTLAATIASETFDPYHVLEAMDWDKLLEEPIRRMGAFSAGEDILLLDAVERREKRGWVWVSSQVPGRTGKQVRERWCNHLDPELADGSITPEEMETALQLVAQHGRRWSHVARELSAWRKRNGLRGRRSDNQIKNVVVSHDRNPERRSVLVPDSSECALNPSRRNKFLCATAQPRRPPPRCSRFVFGERNNFSELNKRLRDSRL